ncbi:dihydrolipoamide acetyltransferase [Frondihabitans sucicola]|uniref:Dihydrolipoamide acetyltransferase n=1 Tax=Frondihabitans sucicola TaxID=1268041 RepID=A0ABM8GTT7_9MICO|nr:alpha/beta hydrolase [Frondihabitans sucicola]BDZ51866.1 dihydrolipoamide acetyltransferase [Frondihabitans sucicola]
MAANSSTEVTVTSIDAGEVSVRVSTIGQGGTRPFVLVPGIGVASNYFERLAPNLNEFGPVHALDLPGFAGVPHPDDAMTIRQYADLVGLVIDRLELDDPVVVGHSMGTQVVVDLVARREELSTLVLIGPVINPRERRIGLQAVRFLQAAAHEPGRVKLLALTAYLFCGPKWFSRILPKMMRFPIERALPHVKADTLVIRGEFDAVAPRDWVKQVGELLPSSRLWEIPGAGHSVMHAHAEEVAKLCVEHAEQPLEYDEGGVLRSFRHAGDGREGEDYKPTPATFFSAVKGRATEALGMLRHDDGLIADGKTEHAEAMQEAHDRVEDE